MTLSQDHTPFLEPTAMIESDHPQVTEFSQRHVQGAADEIETSIRLYYAVRDGIRYDPYTAAVDSESLKASATLSKRRGWCVGKAVLLAACCRSQAIPARLGFADVRNHLSTARMRAAMQTDIFYWHGYTSIFLKDRWVKATPAFNLSLCEKLGLRPLEFDGFEDSIYHPFDLEGRRHMEYLKFRGEFADVPLELMRATFREHYSRLVEEQALGSSDPNSFEREVEAEVE